MNKRMKDILFGIAVIAFIAVFAVWMLKSDIAPIEDTNGPADISLNTITDANILNMDLGALNAATVKKSKVNLGAVSVESRVKISSQEFSGVYELFYQNLIGKSDFLLTMDHLTVEGGNFRMVVIHEDEIVAEITPSEEPIDFMLEDISGYVSVRIAGESAAYNLSMSQFDYDTLAHD